MICCGSGRIVFLIFCEKRFKMRIFYYILCERSFNTVCVCVCVCLYVALHVVYVVLYWCWLSVSCFCTLYESVVNSVSLAVSVRGEAANVYVLFAVERLARVTVVVMSCQ